MGLASSRCLRQVYGTLEASHTSHILIKYRLLVENRPVSQAAPPYANPARFVLPRLIPDIVLTRA